jgi:hypothetical protein
MWNYRIVDLSHENGGEPWLALCEVAYDETGKPLGYSEPCTGSETIEGMREQVARYLAACELPVLTF